MTDTVIKLTFDYSVTNDKVEFNGYSYTNDQFIDLKKELSWATKKDTSIISEKNIYKADYVVKLENGQVLIPAEILCVINLIKMDIIDRESYNLTNFNSYINYMVSCGYIMIIDDEKVRYGIWLIKDILDIGMPVDGILNKTHPNGSVELLRGYPNLIGEKIGMGFTKSNYKKFLELVKSL